MTQHQNEEKDFDGWNLQKKGVEKKSVRHDFFFYEREVWWGILGVNVGVETDGKNQNHERPLLILKKFNGVMLWVVPLTSKAKNSSHYMKISWESGMAWVQLSQIRTISTKRLIRKVGMVSDADFQAVVQGIISYIQIGPRVAAGPSEAEATNTLSLQ